MRAETKTKSKYARRTRVMHLEQLKRQAAQEQCSADKIYDKKLLELPYMYLHSDRRF
jgi:hypothetical protein